MNIKNIKNTISRFNFKSVFAIIILFLFINKSSRNIIIEKFHDIKNYTFIKFSGKSTVSNYNKFHIDNIESIDEIILSDRNGNTIFLKKKNKSFNNWIANNQYNVRNDAIKTLLSTASSIRIKKPVSINAEKKVIDFMATSGIKVSFYSNKSKVLSYTIGSNTPNHLGTYMLLENTSKPFEIHIPTHHGFLSPRFGIQNNSLDINSWRSHNIFNYQKNSIKMIKYLSNDDNYSYTLFTDPLRLLNYKNELITMDSSSVFKLLNSFTSLNCESFKNNINDFKDLIPDECLIINSDTLKVYHMSNDSNTANDELNFNVSRKHAILNNKELILIQDYVFNKVLININDLKK